MSLLKIFESAVVKLNEIYSEQININNLDDTDIINLVKSNGWEGFNNEEDAVEALQDALFNFKELSKINPLKLWRIILVNNVNQINKKELGIHWVADKNLFHDYNWLEGMGISRNNENEKYIIGVNVNPNEDIDWYNTLTNILYHPYEQEITLKQRGANAKLLSVEKLEQ